jgi:ribosomal protein S18 acetylase RimI-like enzyme
MGGRFGKYGDQKRLERLRNKARVPSTPMRESHIPPPRITVTVEESTSPVTFKRPLSRDEDFIRSLCLEAFSRYGPYDKIVVDWLGAQDIQSIVAFTNKKPAGFVMTADANHIKGVSAEIMAIAVHADYRRRGVGERLLKRVEDLAIKRGVQVVILHTSHDNIPAQAFFRKHGYKELGERASYYPAGQAALRMIKRLEETDKFDPTLP